MYKYVILQTMMITLKFPSKHFSKIYKLTIISSKEAVKNLPYWGQTTPGWDEGSARSRLMNYWMCLHLKINPKS